MRKKSTALNIEYSLVQAFFWMGFCVCSAYAAVFLQGRGYSNSELGLIISLGSIAAFIISPSLASKLDRSKEGALFASLWVIIAVQLLVLIGFLLVPGKSVAVSVMYCVYLTTTIIANPIQTQLCFLMGSWGGDVNYGAARGMGSLAYALTSMFVGARIAKLGTGVLTVAALVILACQAAILLRISLEFVRLGKPSARSGSDEKAGGKGLWEFMRSNVRFCMMLLGVAVLFFTHNLITNFMINIVRNVGGDSSDMGSINGVMALLEIPVMLMYERITRRIRCSSTIRFAAMMFVLRALAIALSPGIPGLYAAQLLQAGSFALITPALVQYVSLTIRPEESAKGQSLSYSMTTLGSIFAGLFGGIMYDSLSVRTTLLIGSAVCLAGAVLCFAFVENTRSRAKAE